MNTQRLSILSNAKLTDIQTVPYPHIVIKNALDTDIFQQLQQEYPETEVVLNQRPKKDTWYDYPACQALNNNRISPLWKKFLAYHTSNAFFLEFIKLFGNQLQSCYPEFEKILKKEWSQLTTSIRQPERGDNLQNRITDVSLETQFYVNFTEKVRTVRGPHVDRPTELYAALLYFREQNDDSLGGDLEIIEANNPTMLFPSQNSVKVDHLPMEIESNKVRIVNTVKYEANTLVLFINSAKSIHAVSQRSATSIPRKHINFTADLFNLPDQGLFDIHYSPSKKLKKWLKRQPVIWRWATLIKD